MSRSVFGLIAALAWAGCGAEAPQKAPPSSAPAANSAGSLGKKDEQQPPQPKPTTSSKELPAAPPAPAQDPGPPFPPPAFAPPVARTARPGDGVYTAITEGAADGLLARALVHPHPIKPHPYVVVVAINLRRAALRLAAGTEEPAGKDAPAAARTGLVPPAELPALIAVWNGGFLTKHGQWGMMVDRTVFVPPRDEGCVVALLDDGAVRIGTYQALAPLAPRMRSYRQTPPCLIEGGAPHPSLPAEDTVRLWGAAIGGDREIRRTALGIDESGQTLFFGIGEWVWARDLAAAMLAAGASSVAELDINWSYTRFLLYDKPAPPEPPGVVSTLIPKVEHARGAYITKPAPRDFFYLIRR